MEAKASRALAVAALTVLAALPCCDDEGLRALESEERAPPADRRVDPGDLDAGLQPVGQEADAAAGPDVRYRPGEDSPGVDAGQAEPGCPEGTVRDGQDCVPPYEPQVVIDCVHIPGEQGEDLYWIDSDGQPTLLVEDCVLGVFGSNLNCAGVEMTVRRDATGEPVANAANSGQNPEAFLGCCGEYASTIDRYGCLPYQELGEPCFDAHRYYNRCLPGLACQRSGPGEHDYSCQ